MLSFNGNITLRLIKLLITYEECNENITNSKYQFKNHKTCLGHLQMPVQLGLP